jgi:hypothetical protein
MEWVLFPFTRVRVMVRGLFMLPPAAPCRPPRVVLSPRHHVRIGKALHGTGHSLHGHNLEPFSRELLRVSPHGDREGRRHDGW